MAGARAKIKVSDNQYRWLAGGYDPSWSIKVSIAAQKFATSVLRTVRVRIQPESSGRLWPRNRTFLEVASMVVTWWIYSGSFAQWTISFLILFGKHSIRDVTPGNPVKALGSMYMNLHLFCCLSSICTLNQAPVAVTGHAGRHSLKTHFLR